MNHPVVGTKPGPSPHNERTASEPHLIMIIIIIMMIIIITIIKIIIMKMIRTMIRIVIIILKALPVSHTWCRAHICHEYHELRSWRKNMPCGEISALYTEFEQFMEFYRSLCCFCSISMWRKICEEKICVEKEWQIWGLTWWGLK